MGGHLNLITASPNESQVKRLHSFLERLSDRARFPSITELRVLQGEFLEVLPQAPRSDINIFGVSSEISLEMIRHITITARSSCLFVGDSGLESALV